MPRQEIGIRGYVGERIVEQWLRRRYPPPKYQLVEQVEFPEVSTSAIDFGILKRGRLEKIYEVKTQAYNFDEGMLNKPLKKIWGNPRRKWKYKYFDGKETQTGTEKIKAYLILLQQPSKNGQNKEIKPENFKRVAFFSDIWDGGKNNPNIRLIVKGFKRHLVSTIKALAKLKNGDKKGKKAFLEMRGKLDPDFFSKG